MNGTKVIIFTTTWLTRGKICDYIKEKVEEIGAEIIFSIKFKGLFRFGLRNVIKLRNQINQNQ